MSAAEQLAPSPFTIRFAHDGDKAPILSSWLRSYINDEPSWSKHVERERCFSEHQVVVKRILSRPSTITLVAHNPDAEDHLMSWLCGELRDDALVLHFGYTFAFARKAGAFGALLDKLLVERGARPLVYTHRACAAKIIGPKLGAIFNPYRIFQ